MEVPTESANSDHNTRPLKQLCSQLVRLSSQLNDLQSSSLDLQNLRGPLNHLSIQLHQLSHQLNQLQLSDNKASNQWSDLPTVILEAIYKRLNTRTDFNRMSAVCKPWRTSLSPLKPLCHAKFEPHLTCLADDFAMSLLSDGLDQSSLKCQFSQCTFHLVSHRHHDSIDIMWLAKTSNSGTILMDLDPDHAQYRHIDSLFRPHHISHRVLNSLNYQSVEVCRSYYLTCEGHYSQEVLVAKIAALKDTAAREADFVHLGLSFIGTLAGWNTMTRRWCEVKVYRKERKFVDIISYRNNLYAINTGGQLYKVSQLTWSKGKPTKAPAGAFIGIDDEYWYYNGIENCIIHVLLESDGRLYLLNGYSDCRMKKLNIYVLDEKAWEWKAVKDIGNRVFFVVINHGSNDPPSTFSVSSEDLRRDNGNCVYWFDRYEYNADNSTLVDSWTHWEYSIASSSFEIKHSRVPYSFNALVIHS